MRALIQRVRRAEVRVEDESTGRIDHGLLVFLGVSKEDGEADTQYVTRKIIGLRIFEDEAGKMNRSVEDVGGEILLVSQFTLYGDVRRGRRPGFDRAAPPAEAYRIYEDVRARLAEHVTVATGRFGAYMQVSLVNDGPATFWIDSEDR